MKEKSESIKRILKKIPNQPGVYKMKNKYGEVIYIGKAKNLKKRVITYFQKDNNFSLRTRKLVENIIDIEFVITGSELEAILLETNLIKESRPKYNILMKDDKNFLYIKVTVNEDFPRIYTARRVLKDQAKYFGPKTSAEKTRETVELIRKIFPVRNCNLSLEEKNGKVEVTQKTIKYPCLEFHIKRCAAPCIDQCHKDEYGAYIKKILDFLSGKTDEIIKDLKKQIEKSVMEKNFEQAAKIRDKIFGIESIMEKQKVSAPELSLSQDIIGYFIEKDQAYFNLFQVREGKLIGNENFILDVKPDLEPGMRDFFETFLKQYYEKAADIPKEILVDFEDFDFALYEDWLSNIKGNRVKFLFPKRGKDSKLLEFSKQNAKSYADQYKVKWEKEKERTEGACEELGKILNLDKKIKRMECFDISHLAGEETVGSMVVFHKGKPENRDYRHFKLKLTEGKIDDIKSMEEVLKRRLKYLVNTEEINNFIKKEKIFLRKAKKQDLDFIADRIKKEELDGSELEVKRFLILESGKKIIGFGRIRLYPENLEEIASLWIDSDYRGKKLGGFLLQKLIEKAKAKRIYITCLEKNRGFYEKFGFREIYSVPEAYGKKKCQVCSLLPGKPVHFVYEKKKPDQSFFSQPDLIIVDGGKGQLNIAVEVLKLFKLDLPVMALAKREEEIFIPKKSDPIVLNKDSVVLHLLQRIRDEAHRFAISYNRNLREKTMVKSALDSIPGIGAKIKSKLLKRFFSVYGIKEASMEELEEEVGEKLAVKLKEML